jgi:hypothetical protein
LGVQFQKELPRYCTLSEVARVFGLTRQNAYTASMIALGKLIYRLRKELST